MTNSSGSSGKDEFFLESITNTFPRVKIKAPFNVYFLDKIKKNYYLYISQNTKYFTNNIREKKL